MFERVKTLFHAPAPRMPDFIIIGAQKSGTTSLYHYLASHPQIIPAAQKEVHFFDLQYEKGVAWYKEQFPLLKQIEAGKKIPLSIKTGEASPYYIFHPAVPARVHHHCPKSKILILLRNPADRAISHYHHAVRQKVETLSLTDALRVEADRLQGEREKLLQDEHYKSFSYQHHSYVARGMYKDQLMAWLQYFDPSQCAVIQTEYLRDKPLEVMNGMAQFLGIAPFEQHAFALHHTGEYGEAPEYIHTKLQRTFSVPNETLLAFLSQTKWGCCYFDAQRWI